MKMFHNRISKIHHRRENIISREILKVFVLQIQVRRIWKIWEKLLFEQQLPRKLEKSSGRSKSEKISLII